MRRGRHSQRPKLQHVKCLRCQAGECEKCVDRLLLVSGRDPICECNVSDHQDRMRGEPRRQQIKDPFTGSVHAPGLTVTEGGEVKYAVRAEDVPEPEG